jgi:hypothetical protein
MSRSSTEMQNEKDHAALARAVKNGRVRAVVEEDR